MKKVIALIMAMILTFSVMSISVYAENADEICVTVNGTEFIFEADATEEYINSFIEDYFNPSDDTAQTYGLTCTLFGHDIETSYVTTTTHKARSSAPRCLQQLNQVETCSRCDYVNRTILKSEYISCC